MKDEEIGAMAHIGVDKTTMVDRLMTQIKDDYNIVIVDDETKNPFEREMKETTFTIKYVPHEPIVDIDIDRPKKTYNNKKNFKKNKRKGK